MNLSQLLLENTRTYLQLQKEYKVRKKDTVAKYYTYVLLLQNGKFYVGNTDNIYMRLYHHFTMSQFSAAWVRTHGPVVRVVEILRNCKKEDEHYKTMQYCSMFGCENVRGSWYSRVHANFLLYGTEKFVPDRTDLESLSRIEIEAIENEIYRLIKEYPPTLLL